MTGTEGPMSEVIELIPLLDDEDSQNASATPRKLICKDRTNRHSDLKTLVLFEDVDAALCEDRGFISTIQQLSETAKRPMILTSNSKIIYLVGFLFFLNLILQKLFIPLGAISRQQSCASKQFG